jgi:hypothetical protein
MIGDGVKRVKAIIKLKPSSEMKRGYRNGWILTVLLLIFVLGFFALTFRLMSPDKPIKWDMDGRSFVPASSEYGDGYYQPPPPSPAQKASEPEGNNQ